MNTDHTDKKGIINKMKNLCLPRPPREPRAARRVGRVRVDPCPKNLKNDLIHYLRNKQYPNSKLQKIPLTPHSASSCRAALEKGENSF
jgi:hypothetical protein